MYSDSHYPGIGPGNRGTDMNEQTITMVRGWLAQHNGDTESVARWMRDSLRIGSLRECRRIVQEAAQ